MSKRYIDTDRWKKKKFIDLSPKAKLLYMYAWDNCDHAGIWNINFPLAEFQTKEKFDVADILDELVNSVVVIESGNKFFIPDFIDTVYNNKLRQDVKCQNSAIQILNSHPELKKYLDNYIFSRELPYDDIDIK